MLARINHTSNYANAKISTRRRQLVAMCLEDLATDSTRLTIAVQKSSSVCISCAMSSEHGSETGKCTRVFVEFRKLVPRPSGSTLTLSPEHACYIIFQTHITLTFDPSHLSDDLIFIMAITEGWKDKMAWPRLIVFMVVVFLLLTAVSSVIRRKEPFDLPANGHAGNDTPQEDVAASTWCPVPQIPAPSQDGLNSSADFGNDEDLIKEQVERLSAAVNIPTISYDDNGDVDKDPRWHAFVTLHEVLKEQFPRVYANATRFDECVLTSATDMRR
jgi:hypothetical protein